MALFSDINREQYQEEEVAMQKKINLIELNKKELQEITVGGESFPMYELDGCCCVCGASMFPIPLYDMFNSQWLRFHPE
jgi:hypothetical protein